MSETENPTRHGERQSAGRARRVAEDIVRTPNAVAGLVLVGIFLVLAVVGPSVAPYSPVESDILNRFKPPSWSHPFGTDSFGRDVFSRVLVGARLSLVLAASATLLSILLGTLWGLIAGYYRGWVDEALMRITDALLAIPSIILALVVVATLGSSLVNVILAVGVINAPRIARVLRGGTLALREEEYVQAAKARGESGLYVLTSEILPNTAAPLIVEASIRMGFAILLASSLSFLGLGVSPPTPDWGLMINEARVYMLQAPWLIIFPSAAIALTIVGFNLLGDGIRDIVSPGRDWAERRSEGV